MKVQSNDITCPRLQNDLITVSHNVVKLFSELALIFPQRECTQKQFIIHREDSAGRAVERKIMVGGDWIYVEMCHLTERSTSIDFRNGNLKAVDTHDIHKDATQIDFLQ